MAYKDNNRVMVSILLDDEDWSFLSKIGVDKFNGLFLSRGKLINHVVKDYINIIKNSQNIDTQVGEAVVADVVNESVKSQDTKK